MSTMDFLWWMATVALFSRFGRVMSACPGGFLQYKTRCYKMGPSSSRGDAVTFCQGLNAHLPRPPDQETNWFIGALATRNNGFWLGIEADSNDVGATWRWDDGSDVTFPLPWFSNQPSSGLHAVVDKRGYWLVRDQGSTAHALCETEVEVPAGDCLPRVFLASDHAIVGYNDLALSDIGSATDCLLACIHSTTFTCRSAEYNSATQVCNLSETDEWTVPATAYAAYDLFFPYCEVCADFLHADERVLAAGGPTYGSSSQKDEFTAADQGQLFRMYHDEDTQDNAGVWVPLQDAGTFSWLEVDFHLPARIGAVVIQGIGLLAYESGGTQAWATGYLLAHSLDRKLWHYYSELLGAAKVIPGDWSVDVPRAYSLTAPIIARYIRVNVRTWNRLPWGIRFGALGCTNMVYVPDSYDFGDPLGMEDHHIVDAQLLADSHVIGSTAFYPPWAARIHLPWTSLGTSAQAAWRAGANDEWITVDLLVPHVLTGVAVQGMMVDTTPGFPKTFLVLVSLDRDYTSDTFTAITVADAKGFRGPFESEMVIQWPLDNVTASRVRLTYSSYEAGATRTLRFELYGRQNVSDRVFPEDVTILPRQTACGCTQGSARDWCSSSEPLQVSLDYLYHVTGVFVTSPEADALLSGMQIELSRDVGGVDWDMLAVHEYNVTESASGGFVTYHADFQRAQRAYKVRVTVDRGAASSCATIELNGVPADVCPPTYIHHLKSCYRYYHDVIALVTEGDHQICARTPWLTPGHLITINDPDEGGFLLAVTGRKSAFNVWIGLFANETLPDPWVTSGKPKWLWRWMDGSSVEDGYMNWDGNNVTGQPDELVSGESCARITDNGYYHDAPCSEKRYYMCETEAAVSREEPLLCGWSGRLNTYLWYNTVYLDVRPTEQDDINLLMYMCKKNPTFPCRALNLADDYCLLVPGTGYDGSVSFASSRQWDVLMPYCMETGEQPLIGGPGGVGGAYLSGNEYQADHIPAHAIYGMNHVFYQASTGTFIQIDLRYRYKVNRLHIKGGPWSSGSHFVTDLRLWGSNNSVYWEPKRLLDGKIQTLAATYTFAMVPGVIHLMPPMTARFFRLEPRAVSGSAAMQFELYGVAAQTSSDEDKGCAVEAMGYGSGDVLKKPQLKINGKEYIALQPPQGVHLLRFDVDEVTCFTQHAIEYFDVIGVPDTGTRLLGYVTDLPDDAYVMGITVLDVGSNFYKLSDTFSLLGVDVSSFTANQMSLAFIARKGRPDWTKWAWAMPTKGPVHLWRYLRAFPDVGQDALLAPLGAESREIRHSQLSSKFPFYSQGPPMRGRLFNNHHFWYPSRIHRLNVYLREVYMVSGIVVQGSAFGNGWCSSLQMETALGPLPGDMVLVTSADGKTLTFHGSVDAHTPTVMYFPTPLRAKIVSMVYSTHEADRSIRLELLGSPERMADIEFEATYTTVSSQGADSRCPPESAFIPASAPCDQWCPDILQSWIQVDSGRWYQLSGLDILVTATGEGNVTAEVDVMQATNGVMNSLMSAPPQAFLYRNNESLPDNITVIFSPLLLTNNVRVAVTGQTTYCLALVFHGKEASPCPPGMMQFRQKCLWHIGRANVLASHKEVCSELTWIGPGWLSSPITQDELQDHIKMIINFKQSWTGIYKVVGEGWYLANGSLAPSLPWHSSVDPAANDSLCAFVETTGTLRTKSCAVSEEGICEIDAYVPPDASCWETWDYLDRYFMLEIPVAFAFGHPSTCAQACSDQPSCHVMVLYDGQYGCYLTDLSRYNATLYATPTGYPHQFYERMCLDRSSIPLLQTYGRTNLVNFSGDSFNDMYTADQAILYNDYPWKGISNVGYTDILTITFGMTVSIEAIATQGMGEAGILYPKRVMIFYKHLQDPGWQTVPDSTTGSPKRFFANSDRYHVQIWKLPDRIVADMIEILPSAQHNGQRYNNLKLDLYGTIINTSGHYNALGMEAGGIADGQLGESGYMVVSGGHQSSLSSRYNMKTMASYVNCWQAPDVLDEWLRLTLYSPHRISTFTMQGNTDKSSWCKTYEIYYYKNSLRTLYENKHGITIFAAVYGTSTVWTHGLVNNFDPFIVSDVIEIAPKSYKTSPSLRFEIFGWPQDAPEIPELTFSCGAEMAECPSWCPAGGSFDSIVIDLGRNYHVSTIVLISTETVTSFTTTVSKATELGTWTEHMHAGVWVQENGTFVFSTLMHMNARYLQLEATTSDFSQCVDVRVLGTPMPACPELYAPFGTLCYRPYLVVTEHGDAKRRCHRDGLSWVGNGQLAKVDSFAKNMFIGETYAYRCSHYLPYVDGELSNVTNTFLYSDGSPVEYWRVTGPILPTDDPSNDYIRMGCSGHYLINTAAVGGFVCQLDAAADTYKSSMWHVIRYVTPQSSVADYTMKDSLQVKHEECFHMCLRGIAEGCQSFLYREDTRHCILLTQNRYTVQLKLITSSYWSYNELYQKGSCDGPLLAEGLFQEITASSTLSDEYNPVDAIFGLMPNGTFIRAWRAAAAAADQWVEVTFITTVTLSRITIGGAWGISNVGRVETFKLSVGDEPIVDASDGDQIFLGPTTDFTSITHQLLTAPSGTTFRIDVLTWGPYGIAMVYEFYGCTFRVAETCFGSMNPGRLDSSKVDTNCTGPWTIILHREGVLGNPGLTSSDYTYGFCETNFYWFGVQPFFSLTKNAEFSLRIEMWDENDKFYFAEFNNIKVEDLSTGYHLKISGYLDGYLGDGGLIQDSGMARFTTTDRLNKNTSSCATDADAVYGWWLYTTECNQTLLTADGGPQYLVTEGDQAGQILLMDKVIMKVTESDPTTVNVAINKGASQSSTAGSEEAGLATDGAYDATTATGACAVTQSEASVWWRVDLTVDYIVAHVGITGCSDCNMEALHDYDILVGQTDVTENFLSSGYSLCHHFADAHTAAGVIRHTCGSPINGRYVTITIATGSSETLTLCEVAVYTAAEEPGVLDHPCFWGGACMVPYSACLPVTATREETFTCQCKEFYSHIGDVCIPMLDLTMVPNGDIQYAEVGLVRDVPTSLTVALNMTILEGAKLSEVPDGFINYDIELAVTDGASAPFNKNFSTDFAVTQGWNPQMGLEKGQVLTLQLTLDGKIPPDSCHYVSHVCLRAVPGNASFPQAYYDLNGDNDYACFFLEGLECQPSTDLAFSNLRFSEPKDIIRAVPGVYSFEGDLSQVSGDHPVARMDVEYNYKCSYSYRTSALAAIDEFDPASETVFISSFTDDSRQGAITPFRIEVTQGMSLEGCADWNYLCAILESAERSTWAESDNENNFACLDISTYKICEPPMIVQLDSVVPADGTSITRGYEDFVSFTITLSNIDPVFDIPAISGQNYNVTALCSDGPSRRRRSLPLRRSGRTNENTGRMKRSTLEVGPFMAVDNGLLGSGIVKGDSLNLELSFGVLLPRETCGSLSQICFSVEPATGASYSLALGDSHVQCLDLTALRNCEGIAAAGVVFKPDNVFAATNQEILIFTSWIIGTDITFSINFNDGNTHDWDYSLDDHTLSYGALQTNVSHVYSKYENFTLELHICTSVSCADVTADVVVEPYLEDYIMYRLDYIPSPAPTPIIFIIELINTTFVYPVAVRCTFHFNDDDPAESLEEYKEIGNDGISVEFTYTVFRHTSVCNIMCLNHVSKVDFEAVVALQENITNFFVEPLEIGVITGETVGIRLTVETGSNIIFVIDYGDTMMEVVNNNDSWVTQDPLILQHTYSDVGNYTVTVVANNVHFNVTELSVHDVIAQNEVRDMAVTCGTDIAFPPAVVDCMLTPDASHWPTDVFCDFSLNNKPAVLGSYIPEISSGTAVDYQFVARREHIGPLVPVDIICRNLVSEQVLSRTTAIYEEIVGLSVAMDNMGLVKGEQGTLLFQVENGSSVDFIIDYGDGDSETVSHPLLFASDQPLAVNHTYAIIGNKTLTITATNPVSQLIEVIPESVVVQNRITHIAFTASASILWPREVMDFQLIIDEQQEPLADIHCVWDVGGISTLYRYVDSADTGDQIDFSDPLLRSHIGSQNITLTCSNLVSSFAMVQESDIILDAVIMGQLVCNESVWWTNTSGFVLDIALFGQYSCFVWDMGGDDAMFMYGESICQDDATANGYPFTLIERGTMVIGHDYLYSDWGVYDVIVFAYNDVSNHTIATRATVWEWICLTPNITVSPINNTDEAHPMVWMRSEYFEITMIIEQFCFYTSYTDDWWTFTNVHTGVEELSFTDERVFIHNPRHLPYGLYRIDFLTQMHNIPEKNNQEVAFLEIIKTPLNVSIVGGPEISIPFGVSQEFNAIDLTSDPDVSAGDLTGIVFSWACVQHNSSDLESEMRHRMTNYYNIFPNNRTAHCLLTPPYISASHEGAITANTELFYPQTTHLLTVTITKDTRTSKFEQLVYVEPPVAPETQVFCRSNCFEKAAQSLPIVIKVECLSHCTNVYGGFHFRWLLYREDVNEPLQNLSAMSANGLNQLSIFIKEGSLVGGYNYRMDVEGWTPGSVITVNSLTFKVNKLPYGGRCTVNPRTGIASETEFVFDCNGWLEWQPPAGGFALQFYYYVREVGSVREFPVFFGDSPKSAAVAFPVGRPDLEFELDTVIKIFDSVGDYTEFVNQATVRPKPIPGDEVLFEIQSGVSGTNSKVAGLMAQGAFQEAASLVFAFISEINVPAHLYLNSTDPTVDISALRRQVRGEIIQAVRDFPVESVGALTQNNEIMRTALLVPEEVDVGPLSSASDQLQFLTQKTLDFDEADQLERPEMVANDIGGTTIKVMLVADYLLDKSTSVQSNETDVLAAADASYMAVANVMENSVTIIEDISGMLSSRMEAGDPAAVFAFDEMTVVTSKVTPTGLEPTFSAAQGAVSLPPPTDLFGPDLPGCFNIEAMFTEVNPYIYGSQRGDSIKSSVTQFRVIDCDVIAPARRRRRRQADSGSGNVTDSMVPKVPFGVTVVPSPISAPAEVARNVTSDSFYQYHLLRLSEPNKPVQVDVYPRPWNQSLELVIGLNMLASRHAANWSVPLDLSRYNETSNEIAVTWSAGQYYSIFIPASNLTNGTLYAAVLLPDCKVDPDALCPSESEPVLMEYAIRVMEVTCQVWDDVRRLWNTEDCQMDGPVSETHAVFKSNLFGSLGAGVFVGPNLIDFSTVFDNVGAKILENLPVFVTVILLILMYIPLVIICRKFDKRDERKWAVLPLAGAGAGIACGTRPYTYELHLYTGFMKHSETESNISLVVIGTQGDSGVMKLSDGERKNFNKGDINSFSFCTPHDIGGLYTVRIWHDNSGPGPRASWYLSKVVVVDVEKSMWYLFSCNRWFAEDHDDGKTDRLLRLTSKDSIESGVVLRSNLNRKFYEDHLWLSIIFRRCRSSYTRVQRLSTAWALLFLTMISNAMWFKDASEDTDNQAALNLGPISLTTYQLYASIMSSLTVVPAILLITYCYVKACPKSEEAKSQETCSETKSTSSPVVMEDGSLSVDFDLLMDTQSMESSSRFTEDKPEEATGSTNERKRPKGTWPHWVVFVAWSMVVLSVWLSAFFTILYSFQWGGVKSTAWLMAFLLSFVESILIIQPLKVLLVAALISFLLKQDIDTHPYEDKYGEMQEPVDVFGQDAEMRDNPWGNIEEEDRSALQHRRSLEKRMTALIWDVCHQVIFLCFALALSYSNQDADVFRQNESLKSIYLNKIHLVVNTPKMWSYMQTIMVPGMYWRFLSNGEVVPEYEEKFIGDMLGYRLGQPRLRQLRVKKDFCLVPYAMRHTTWRCTNWYASSYPPLDNDPYLTWWQVPTNISSVYPPREDTEKAFIYSSADEINGNTFWANLATYDGGGYVSTLGDSLLEAQDTVEGLRQGGWVDQYTRAVFAEWAVLNVNSNLFSMVTLVFEFPPSGGVWRYHAFDTIKLYRYVGATGLVTLLLEIVCFLFFITVVYRVVKRCAKQGRAFAFSLIGLTYLFVIVAFVTAAALYAVRSVWTVSTLEEVMNNRDRGVSFSRVLSVDSLYTLLIGLVAFFVQIQLLHTLRYSRTISAFANTILAAKGDLVNLSMLTFVGLLAFGAIAHVIYGPALRVYMTLPYSVMNLCVYVMGKFDYMAHAHAGGVPAQVFLLVYLLCAMILLLDIFITLLNEFLSEIKTSGKNAHPDEEVIDYLLQNIKSFFLNVEQSQDIPKKKPDRKESSDMFTPPWYPPERQNPYKAKLIKMSD